MSITGAILCGSTERTSDEKFHAVDARVLNGRIPIGLVGLGKIAHNQHIPALTKSDRFALVAGASPAGELAVGRTYRGVEAMLSAEPDLGAVAMCQPPQVRFAAARHAIQLGKHVLLEKPPGVTLGEVKFLSELARAWGVSLFAAWHSRFAPAVEPARAWLAGRTLLQARVIWKEDVRAWHPGQQWIWEPGGLGVFDPGINALSILTRILPDRLLLDDARLFFPSNRCTPIAADLVFRTAGGATVIAGFDWRQSGEQSWEIAVDTEDGELRLSGGGLALTIDGEAWPMSADGEYESLYRHFAGLIDAGRSDVDVEPLRHVADAFLRGARIPVEPFHD